MHSNMNDRKRSLAFTLIATAIVAVTSLTCMIQSSIVYAASALPEVVFEQAEIVDSAGITDTSGAITVQFEDNHLRFTIHNLEYPGAGVTIRTTAKNIGGQDAYYVSGSSQTQQNGFLIVSHDDPIKTDLAPGESHDIYLHVWWDPDDTTNVRERITQEFALDIRYENPNAVAPDPGSPSTGDSTSFLWIIVFISDIAILILLLLLVLRRRQQDAKEGV